MEERSVLRRPISETTNSLSVSDRVRPSLDFFWRWPSGSRDTRVRERVSAEKLGRMCLGHLVSQPTPPGRVLLPAARRAEVITSGSSARAAGGKQETQGVETALPDSFDRSYPSGRVARHPADPASVSHQATAVDLGRSGH